MVRDKGDPCLLLEGIELVSTTIWWNFTDKSIPYHDVLVVRILVIDVVVDGELSTGNMFGDSRESGVPQQAGEGDGELWRASTESDPATPVRRPAEPLRNLQVTTRTRNRMFCFVLHRVMDWKRLMCHLVWGFL